MSSTEENPINSLIITRESVNNLGPEDDPGPRSHNQTNLKPEDEEDVGSEGLQKTREGENIIGGHQQRQNMNNQIDQLKSENLNLKRVLDEKETLISVLTSNLHSVIEERNNLKMLALKAANDDMITAPSSGYDHLLQKQSSDTGGYVGLSSLIGSLGSQMTPDRTTGLDNERVAEPVSVKQEINGQDEMTIEEVDSSMTSSSIANDVIVPNVLNRSNFGISLGNQKIDLGDFLNSIKELGQGQTTGLDLIQSLNQKGGKKRRKEVDEEMATIAKKASLEDIKPNSEGKYECSCCSYQTKFRHNLKNHMVKHTGERPFKCDICGQKFAWQSVLKVHMRLHTGEKPIQCTICKERFVQSVQLKNHMHRFHNNEVTPKPANQNSTSNPTNQNKVPPVSIRPNHTLPNQPAKVSQQVISQHVNLPAVPHQLSQHISQQIQSRTQDQSFHIFNSQLNTNNSQHSQLNTQHPSIPNGLSSIAKVEEA